MVDYFLWFVPELRFKVMRAVPSLLLTYLLLMVRRFRWFQLKKNPKQKQSPNQLLMNKFKKILAIAYEMHSTWFVLSRVTLSPK